MNIDFEDIQFEDRMSAETGWPGDGSGMDDLADHGNNEAEDYRDEGMEDSYLDSYYEDRTEVSDDYE